MSFKEFLFEYYIWIVAVIIVIVIGVIGFLVDSKQNNSQENNSNIETKKSKKEKKGFGKKKKKVSEVGVANNEMANQEPLSDSNNMNVGSTTIQNNLVSGQMQNQTDNVNGGVLVNEQSQNLSDSNANINLLNNQSNVFESVNNTSSNGTISFGNVTSDGFSNSVQNVESQQSTVVGNVEAQPNNMFGTPTVNDVIPQESVQNNVGVESVVTPSNIQNVEPQQSTVVGNVEVQPNNMFGTPTVNAVIPQESVQNNVGVEPVVAPSNIQNVEPQQSTVVGNVEAQPNNMFDNTLVNNVMPQESVQNNVGVEPVVAPSNIQNVELQSSAVVDSVGIQPNNMFGTPTVNNVIPQVPAQNNVGVEPVVAPSNIQNVELQQSTVVGNVGIQPNNMFGTPTVNAVMPQESVQNNTVLEQGGVSEQNNVNNNLNQNSNIVTTSDGAKPFNISDMFANNI